MKKIFTMLATALVSVAMWAGANDLLWDYTEKAPTDNPDNGLYYGSKVADAPSTNNGLNGIKLNGSGYCYFTKVPVAGKLKLSFGPRSGTNKASIEVFTWTGETPAGETSIAKTTELSEYGTVIVELTEVQNNIYIKRLLNTETVLQKIEFKENIARSFTDFKIEFREDPYKILLPESGILPAGVTVEGTTYNGGQHGIQGGVITVPVDGPVKFTIGACQYSNTPIKVQKDGKDLTTVDNKAACGETAGSFAQNVLYIYTGEAATLTFTLANNTYVPYFFAEATEITPCEVIYKDQNGKELGRFETYEGATLTTIPYDANDLPAIGEGNVFRGWLYTSGKKAKEGDVITGNTTIQAKVTPFETATVGSVQTYDFASAIFYPEDHETVTVSGGSFQDGMHGWYFNADGTIELEVAGNAIVNVTLCTYSETGDAVLTTADGKEIGRAGVEKNTTADGTETSFKYTGAAGRLTLSFTAKAYIHKIVVYNVLDFLEKDAATGYYMVPANDVASFLLALVQAESGDRIFLPNGVYDLGETVLTTVSKDNISIIGQSMEGVIIKNAPDAQKESIDKTATLRIAKNVKNTYLQDLTLQNALDYYKNNNGRAVALWDLGTQTVCKNVRLLSYQDTYYSNLQGAVKYFEDCEIHGTVDFICGDGSVYFKNNLLYCEKRNTSGGGNDALTANNGVASDRGYVFEGCTVKSECPTVSMGRAWNNSPAVAFLNTTVDYSAGTFSFTDSDGKIARWTKELMNANAWPRFGEYNTHLADGTVLTPASNVVKFLDTKSGNTTKEIETVLTAEQAASYTMEYTLGNWAANAKADAQQMVLTYKEGQWNPTSATRFLVEKNGEAAVVTTLPALPLEEGTVVRAANARGGFGSPAHEGEPGEGLTTPAVNNDKASKILLNGQIVILRGEKQYTMLGAEL